MPAKKKPKADRYDFTVVIEGDWLGLLSVLVMSAVLLTLLTGCARQPPVELRAAREDKAPVLVFQHDDGWETRIYCDEGAVQKDLQWYQFVTKCPHDALRIVRIPAKP